VSASARSRSRSDLCQRFLVSITWTLSELLGKLDFLLYVRASDVRIFPRSGFVQLVS